MRVVLIAQFPPLPAAEADHAFHLSNWLARKGMEVHVVTMPGATASSMEMGIQVHRIMPNWSWRELPGMVRFLKSCSPDAILLVYDFWSYSGLPMVTFLPSVCKAVLPSTRFVTLFEDSNSITPFGYVPIWNGPLTTRAIGKAIRCWAQASHPDPLYGTLLHDSDHIIVVSDRIASELAERSPGVLSKTTVIPVPPIVFFCPDEQGEARRTKRCNLALGPDDFLLAYFGFIYPTKGVETLLKAFRRVCQRKRNAKLLLIGGFGSFPDSVDYHRELQQMPRNLQIEDKVFWTGHFPWDSDEGSRCLRAADIGVLPYDTGVCVHNSSFTVAVAHGLPIVTTRGETLDAVFLDGHNVLLCPPKDPEALAAAIAQVMEEPQLRSRLVAGALELARGWFSWENAIERTIETLVHSDTSVPGERIPA